MRLFAFAFAVFGTFATGQEDAIDTQSNCVGGNAVAARGGSRLSAGEGIGPEALWPTAGVIAPSVSDDGRDRRQLEGFCCETSVYRLGNRVSPELFSNPD